MEPVERVKASNHHTIKVSSMFSLLTCSIDYPASGNYDEYKEQAAKMAEKVSESAKFYKDKALDWFT